MKKDIHPEYFVDAQIICHCGNVIVTGSTKKEQHVEICSACHPFYTGKQKLVDTAGRVNKFLARQKKAQEKQAALGKAEVKEESKKEDKEEQEG